jgi:hypothetical protein
MLKSTVGLYGLDLRRLLDPHLRRLLDLHLGRLLNVDELDLFNFGTHGKALRKTLRLRHWWNDYGIFLVHALVSSCNSCELLIGDIELLIDTMEESLAEWSALIVTDDAVK